MADAGRRPPLPRVVATAGHHGQVRPDGGDFRKDEWNHRLSNELRKAPSPIQHAKVHYRIQQDLD